VGFVVNKMAALGLVSCENLFPLPILIILGWYNRSISGLHITWAQSHPTPPSDEPRLGVLLLHPSARFRGV
jgi:hypothetical protein